MKRTSPSRQIFKPAMAATLAIIITCGLSVRPAQAGYILTLQQVGPNVVATGSGAIDLTGLTFVGTGNAGASIDPSYGRVQTPAGLIDAYSGIIGPSSFGPGGNTEPNSGSGIVAGIDNGGSVLVVAAGYISDSPLSNTSTCNNATLQSLGATLGTYEWTWGTGADQNFTLMIGAVPEPSTWAAGLLTAGVILCSIWRRRKVS